MSFKIAAQLPHGDVRMYPVQWSLQKDGSLTQRMVGGDLNPQTESPSGLWIAFYMPKLVRALTDLKKNVDPYGLMQGKDFSSEMECLGVVSSKSAAVTLGKEFDARLTPYAEKIEAELAARREQFQKEEAERLASNAAAEERAKHAKGSPSWRFGGPADNGVRIR
jgi:hypothetical protein